MGLADDDEIERSLFRSIPENMARSGLTTIRAVLRPVKDIINRRQFPQEPLTEAQVEWLLRLLSSMDSDKDPEMARVGEREGRTVSTLLDRLSCGFNHGIGRSGSLTDPQPKAIGASLMQRIADQIAVDAIRKLGLPEVRYGMIVPMATGMAIAMVLSALRREYGVSRVLWPRVDHLSPRRAILFAGLQEVPVATTLDGDAVRADINDLHKKVCEHPDCVVLATTTFFPPRAPDPIRDIACMCAENNIPLIINNAYGVQSVEIMQMIRSAIVAGRVDAIIQSTDKNFLTPVGGSILVSPDESVVTHTASTYAGRASAAPHVQALAALLLLGQQGYERLRMEQSENRQYLETRMREIADTVSERLLVVENPVACAMTLDTSTARRLGPHLYSLRVTGPRVVPEGAFGACIDCYPYSYVVVNAAIGARRQDVKVATTKLFKEIKRLKSKTN